MSESSNRIAICAVVIIVVISIAGILNVLMIFNPLNLPGTTDTTSTTGTTSTTTTTTTGVSNPHEVAIVFATGGLGDLSFNDGCKVGLDNAVADFGISYVYEEPTSITDYELYLRAYAQHVPYNESYDLIISIGFDQADAVMSVASDYPNQKFAIVDMFIDNETYPNVASLLFSEHEGAALVGAIAGLMTKTGDIGFVGGMDIPLINKFAGGYIFGANFTLPGVNFSIAYTNDWVDTTAGQNLANTMYITEKDVIFAAAGRAGLGVFASAKENNETSENPLWVIGNDSPQMWLGCSDPENPEHPTVGLTSLLKRVDVAIYAIVEDVTSDSFHGGIHTFNLANGGVDYEINEDLLILPEGVLTAVEDMKGQIVSGTVIVPDTKYWL